MGCGCSFGGTGGAFTQSGVFVSDEGVLLNAQRFQRLNFIGAGVVAADAGGQVANITIAGTSTYVLPEQWSENNVRRNLVDAVVDCQVSTHFNTYKAIRSGSLTALSTRFTLPITAGSALVIVSLNGAPTALSLLHTNAANQTGGIALAAVGAAPYVAGDLIGVFLTTNGTFAPTTTDLEAMIQVTE